MEPLSTTHEEISPASLTDGFHENGPVCVACGVGPATYQPDICSCSYSYCKKCAMKCATGGKCKICSAFYSSFILSGVGNSTAGGMEDASPGDRTSTAGDDTATPTSTVCVVCGVGEAVYQPDSCDCSFSYCKKCAMKCATGGKCKKCMTFYSGFINNMK